MEKQRSVRTVSCLPPAFICAPYPGILSLGFNCSDQRKSAAKVIEVELRDGRLVPLEEAEEEAQEEGVDSWTDCISPGRHRLEQNIEVVRRDKNRWSSAGEEEEEEEASSSFVLRTTRLIEANEELFVWYSEELSRELCFPFLTPANVKGGASIEYACTSCAASFQHPNPLKAHIRFHCKTSPASLHPPHPPHPPLPPLPLHPLPLPPPLLLRLRDHQSWWSRDSGQLQWSPDKSKHYAATEEDEEDEDEEEERRRSKVSSRKFTNGILEFREEEMSSDLKTTYDYTTRTQLLMQTPIQSTPSYVPMRLPLFPSLLPYGVISPSLLPFNDRRLPSSSSSSSSSSFFSQPHLPSSSVSAGFASKAPSGEDDDDDDGSTLQQQQQHPAAIEGGGGRGGGGGCGDLSALDDLRQLIYSSTGRRTKRGYLCLFCGKLYSRKYGLKIHVRTHTGFKPLKCRVCLRPFGDPSNLNKHIRLHAEGETPYRCQHCGKVLVRRRDLERHIRSRHSTEAAEVTQSDADDNVTATTTTTVTSSGSILDEHDEEHVDVI